MIKRNSLRRKDGIGSRKLYTRIKKRTGSIKASSRHWLERHLNDPYVRQSWIDGYRSRSAYKLIEINDKYRLLKKGKRVIDLGTAPGGWSQVSSRFVCSNNEKPLVVGIDFLPVDSMPGVSLLEMNFLDDKAPERLLEILDSKPDLVISDMAAPTTGHRHTDHLRTMYLCEMAANFAISVLKPDGHFLTKTFQGGAENELISMLKQNFKSVYHVKPPSSRAESTELYLLAREFLG